MVWDLQQIGNTVRNVTGSPSADQISNETLNAYINNYYVYKMPFELKEQVQLDFYDFFIYPGVNVYPFSGSFLTDQPGAYVDGVPLIFYQDPDIFYQDFPQQYAVDTLFAGDGIQQIFTGGLQNPPIIIGTTFFTDGFQIIEDKGSRNASQTIALGNGGAVYNGTLFVFPILAGSLSITDGEETFVDNGAGLLTGSAGGTGTIDYTTGVYSLTFFVAVPIGEAITASYVVVTPLGLLTGNGIGTINYQTGAFNIAFNSPPPASATIYAKYQGYQPNRPQGMLFFQNQFTFMPIPDQVYTVRMQGYVNPNPLAKPGDLPSLPEWGPLIAYGAALDIFSDRGDVETYDRYYPIFKRYENIALARTVQQMQAEQSIERW